jgi:hypothetical protein
VGQQVTTSRPKVHWPIGRQNCLQQGDDINTFVVQIISFNRSTIGFTQWSQVCLLLRPHPSINYTFKKKTKKKLFDDE